MVMYPSSWFSVLNKSTSVVMIIKSNPDRVKNSENEKKKKTNKKFNFFNDLETLINLKKN